MKTHWELWHWVKWMKCQWEKTRRYWCGCLGLPPSITSLRWDSKMHSALFVFSFQGDGVTKPKIIQAWSGKEEQHRRHSCQELLLAFPTLLENKKHGKLKACAVKCWQSKDKILAYRGQTRNRRTLQSRWRHRKWSSKSCFQANSNQTFQYFSLKKKKKIKNGWLTKLIPWKKPLRKKLVSVSLDVLKDQAFLEGKL